MYAWYFPKDMSSGVVSNSGHRHNWASAVVWLDNPALEKPKILAVSTSTATEGYNIEKDATAFAKYINGTTPMLAYGVSKYLFEYYALDMTTETGELQNLVMWEQLTEEARDALSETDFGETVKVPFVDAKFNAYLEASHPY